VFLSPLINNLFISTSAQFYMERLHLYLKIYDTKKIQ